MGPVKGSVVYNKTFPEGQRGVGHELLRMLSTIQFKLTMTCLTIPEEMPLQTFLSGESYPDSKWLPHIRQG